MKQWVLEEVDMEKMEGDDLDDLFTLLAQPIYASLFQPIRRDAYYLPA